MPNIVYTSGEKSFKQLTDDVSIILTDLSNHSSFAGGKFY